MDDDRVFVDLPRSVVEAALAWYRRSVREGAGVDRAGDAIRLIVSAKLLDDALSRALREEREGKAPGWPTLS